MKKIIIGCCLMIVGALADVALLISLSFHINTLGSWSDPPGKLIATIGNTGASVLIIPIIVATLLFIIGIYLLLKEYKKYD